MSDSNIPPSTFPAENGVHVFRAGIIMPLITLVFVVGRFYSRLVLQGRRMDLSDWIVAATMISIFAHGATMCVAAYNGMGLHIYQYTPALNERYYLWVGISSEFYVTSLMGFKFSLLLLYLQVFGSNKYFRWAVYATMFFVFGYLISNLFTEFLGCNPPSKMYKQNEPGECINTTAANISYGAGSMISDLVIAILPVRMVWTLQFPTRQQKFGLSMALGCGIFAWIVGCARWGIATYDLLSYDRTWWAGVSFTLSILEVNTGLICACVATLSPLLNMGMTNVRSWTYRNSWSGEKSDMDQTVLDDYDFKDASRTNLSEDYESIRFGATASPNDLDAPYDLSGMQGRNSVLPPEEPPKPLHKHLSTYEKNDPLQYAESMANPTHRDLMHYDKGNRPINTLQVPTDPRAPTPNAPASAQVSRPPSPTGSAASSTAQYKPAPLRITTTKNQAARVASMGPPPTPPPKDPHWAARSNASSPDPEFQRVARSNQSSPEPGYRPAARSNQSSPDPASRRQSWTHDAVDLEKGLGIEEVSPVGTPGRGTPPLPPSAQAEDVTVYFPPPSMPINYTRPPSPVTPSLRPFAQGPLTPPSSLPPYVHQPPPPPPHSSGAPHQIYFLPSGASAEAQVKEEGGYF